MLQFLSDNLNPIFVKEIRQFTRSNFIAVLVSLYILLLVFAFLHFLSAFDNGTDNLNAVKIFWQILCNIVLLACFFSVVVRTACSTFIERNNNDLMFYSFIKPSTIVLGKLLTGAVTTFILMSITIPFVVLLNLIGVNDLQCMALILMEIFIVIQVVNAMAILIASTFKISFSYFISLLIALIATGMLYMVLTYVIEYWNKIEQLPERFFEMVGLLASEIIAFVLIVCIAIMKFSPKKSNRSFYVRLVATVIFVLMTFLGTLFVSLFDYWLIYILFLSFVILMFFLTTVVCENDQWTPRIRRSLPKFLFLRFILFPFYTGSACGLVWIGLLTTILVLVDLSVIFPLSAGNSLFGSLIQGDRCRKIVLLFIFIFDICVTAMLIRSWFFKQIDVSRVRLIAILVLLFVVLGSIIVAGIYFAPYDVNFLGFTNHNSTWWIKYQESRISSINPFMLFAISDSMFLERFLERPISLVIDVLFELIVHEEPLSRCYVAIGWAIILLPFLVIWYLQRLKNFSPYNIIEETISYEEAKEAVKNSIFAESAN